MAAAGRRRREQRVGGEEWSGWREDGEGKRARVRCAVPWILNFLQFVCSGSSFLTDHIGSLKEISTNFSNLFVKFHVES
jgi:hypothetical protein